MSRDDGSYQGFGDANDFLPDENDHQTQEDDRESDRREWAGKRRIRPLAKIVISLLVLAGIALVLNATLLKIRHIRINGNRSFTAAEVAQQAGLNKDMSYFTVNEAQIRTALERNPYLEFVTLRKQFPSTLVLFIKERSPCANVQGGGIMYLVDENANVLQTFNTAKTDNTLPVVIGLQVSEAKSGSRIVSSRIGKVDEYCQVMEELLLQGVVNEFDQINLTDSEHIYLRHRLGYVADLGTAKELMAKIGTLRAVISALQEEGLRNGYIDVMIPGEAIYSPE